MNLLTRISASLSATASQTVARFENHRAIGHAAIERARASVAEARATERRHQRQGDELDARLDATRTVIDTWTRRARQAGDDTTALQCLQRRDEERERLGHLDRARHRHAAERHRLCERVRELERGLDRMVQRYDTLSTRETLARAGSDLGPHNDGHLDEVFERWETRVDVAEMSGHGTPACERAAWQTGHDQPQALDVDGDRLERRFVDQERERRLADELRALRAETEQAG